jgi:AraC-like DNA-binding protein
MRTTSSDARLPDPWKPVDPLGEALGFLRMSGVFYCQSEFTAPWALALPAFEHSMMFHVVTDGQCWLEVDDAGRCLLQPGTLALVPHGEGHRLIGESGAAPVALFDADRQFVSDRYEILRHGGGGRHTSMLCGLVRFDHPAAGDLMRWLPRVISLQVSSSPHVEWLQSTLRLVAAEAQAMRPGGEVLITRLADILVLETIRHWVARDPAERVGWLSALRDTQIGRALSLIHRDPARRWTVGSLASAIGMSRSAFAARFTQLVGVPVMHYVTQWKMHAARLSLAHEGPPLGELADRLGYSTEAAFSRAFKRTTGLSPGSVKRHKARGRDDRIQQTTTTERDLDEKLRSMDPRQL